MRRVPIRTKARTFELPAFRVARGRLDGRRPAPRRRSPFEEDDGGRGRRAARRRRVRPIPKWTTGSARPAERSNPLPLLPRPRLPAAAIRQEGRAARAEPAGPALEGETMP